jgi:hypothetical protein
MCQLRRANTDRLIGKSNGQGVPVRLAVDGNGANAEFLARADDAQRNFTAVGNKDFLEHEFSSRTSKKLLIDDC